jgi:MoaA/NifB/PqqE/SkfB family radical SAM enzyme/alpha-beta hydrolase superfamily lysophospholipase
VLVHGYTESAANLASLAARLEERNPALLTTTVGLHDCAETAAMTVPRPPAPRFDGERFVNVVTRACEAHREAGRELVLIGHSTGGSVALEALAELMAQRLGWTPLLLVLASIPGPFDSAYAIRWHMHLGGRGAQGTPFIPPTLADMGRLAQLVTSAAGRRFPQRFPVLFLQGEEDDLAPRELSSSWLEGRFALSPRHALVLGAGHDPFAPSTLERSAQLIERDLADASAWYSRSYGDALFSLGKMEPSLRPFFLRQPLSARHVVESPAGWRALGRDGEGLRLPLNLEERASTEPVFLNLEVTTRGRSACATCPGALGSQGLLQPQDLSLARLSALLGTVPTAAQVNFAGLGEPLCHPEIDRLVALSSEAARRTGIVTGAAALSLELGRALLEAGLDALAFRLDALSPQVATELRPGIDIETVTQNIRRFVEMARRGMPGRVKKPPTLVVVTTLSTCNAGELSLIVDFAVDLKLDALMVGDLHDAAKRERSLVAGARAETKRRLRGAVSRGLKKGLPIVGPQALEEIGPSARPKDVLLFPPQSLWTRSLRHTRCLSPWQSLNVAVDGRVSACDCRSDDIVGNVFEQPLADIWNGETIRRERAIMGSDSPPEACLFCPRF